MQRTIWLRGFISTASAWPTQNPQCHHFDLEKFLTLGFPGAAVLAAAFLIKDYVSLSQSWSMNGHTQSGGHWNVALGLLRNSGFLGSSGGRSESGEVATGGVLLIMCDISSKKESGAAIPVKPRHNRSRRTTRGPRQFLHIPRLDEGIAPRLNGCLFKIAQFWIVGNSAIRSSRSQSPGGCEHPARVQNGFVVNKME